MTERECSCHPDEAPQPCQHRYALTACYAARTRQLEGENKALVLQNAMLRQRSDLPADRLPAAREYEEEIARLRRCLAKQSNTYMIAYEDGKHERLARALCEANDECDRFRLKIERLRAALEAIKALPGEINPSNYDYADVVALNDAFIEAFQIARAALAQGGDA